MEGRGAEMKNNNEITPMIIAKELLLKLPSDAMRLETVSLVLLDQSFRVTLDTFYDRYLASIVHTLTSKIDCERPVSYYPLTLEPEKYGAVESTSFRNGFRCVRVVQQRLDFESSRLFITYDLFLKRYPPDRKDFQDFRTALLEVINRFV
jgi:hypothetical protein